MPDNLKPSLDTARRFLEAIQTNFGAAVLVLLAFGVALVVLCIKAGSDDGSIDATYLALIGLLIFLMVFILIGIIAVRSFIPDALSGPVESTRGNRVIDSSLHGTTSQPYEMAPSDAEKKP